MDKDTFRAIKILALKAIESPDWDDWYRGVCRWYSKEFSTALPQVELMSEENVLRTYFEEKYANLSMATDEATQKEYERLKETIGLDQIQAAVEEKQEEDQEDAWAQEMIDQVKNDWKDKPKEPENNPNLMDLEENFSLPGENSISNDEE